jgi:hypothetical protein
MNLQEASEKLRAIMPEGYYGSVNEEYFFSNANGASKGIMYYEFLVVIQRDKSNGGIDSLFHKSGNDLSALMAEAEAACREVAPCS